MRLWYCGTGGQETPGCWGHSAPRTQPHPSAGLHLKIRFGPVLPLSFSLVWVISGFWSCGPRPRESLGSLCLLLESQEKPGILFANCPLWLQCLSSICTLPTAQCLKRRCDPVRGRACQDLSPLMGLCAVRRREGVSGVPTLHTKIARGTLLHVPYRRGRGHGFCDHIPLCDCFPFYFTAEGSAKDT